MKHTLENNLQLKKYETDPFSSTFPEQYDSLFDYSRICKSCEHEIIFVSISTLAD